MVEIWFPYGASEVPVRVPDENLVDILQPRNNTTSELTINFDQVITEDVVTAAKNAEQICMVIGNSRKKNLISDTTKSLIASFANRGVTLNKITIVQTHQSEPIDGLTDLPIMHHSPIDSPTVTLGGSLVDFTPTISKIAAESKLTIAIGELMLHHFTGYAGLCDLIFPGLTSEKTALEELIRNKPMDPHDLCKERLKVSSLLQNVYALGIVLKSDMSIAKVSLGPFNDTVNSLSEVVNQLASVEASKAADIVVMSAGGSPFDESLLRAVEALPPGLSVLKRNGALIVAAECSRGHGGTDFYAWSNEHKEVRHLESRLRHRFNYYGWKAAYLLRVLTRHRVYLVSAIPDYYVERTFGLRSAKTMNTALESAQRALGADSSITVIPNANQIIPRFPAQTTESPQDR
jgi:nickel-dependent lactate racemase